MYLTKYNINLLFLYIDKRIVYFYKIIECFYNVILALSTIIFIKKKIIIFLYLSEIKVVYSKNNYINLISVNNLCDNIGELITLE